MLRFGALVAGLLLAAYWQRKTPREQHVKLVVGAAAATVTGLELQYVTPEGDAARSARMAFDPGAAPRVIAHDPELVDGDYGLRIDIDTREGRRSTERRVTLGGGTTQIDLTAALAGPIPRTPDLALIDPKSPEAPHDADPAARPPADEPPTSRRRTYDSGNEISTRAAASLLGAPSGVQAIVLTGAHKGTSKVVGGRLTIGKAADNDLVLSDDTVSRHHCEIVRAPDGLHVRDLDSTNGTKIDNTRIREATVRPGSVLKVGEVDIQFKPTAHRVEVLPSEHHFFGPAIGSSLAMRTIFGVLERIAPTDATVLLEGETGTGKDVLARAIWEGSPRANKPFLVVDCGAVTYSLIESELFGHERGAFTGAIATRQGAFELADGGTVFLDEIGELPLDVQPKLLRVLETREYRRVGGNKTLASNVRVIAATKRDLHREVAGGKFREDLYFRLAVVPLTVPPLRARRDDIPAIVNHLLKAAGGPDVVLSPESMQALAAHDWPGNVRELRNVLERATYMAQATGSKEIRTVTMPTGHVAQSAEFHFDPNHSYRETRAKYDGEFERRYVKWLLGRHGGNISAAAREAKMDRKHLHDMAKKHGGRGSEGDSGL